MVRRDGPLLFTNVHEQLVNVAFDFNNQGASDTITLYDVTSGVTIGSIDLAPSAGAYRVTADWPLEADHTYRLTNAGPSNGRWTSYSSYPTGGDTIEVEGVWTFDALHTDYWFTFTDLTTSACTGEEECEEHTFEGPVLIHDIHGWSDSGIQFVALFDTTLDSFVFNNQGSADTITLYDATSGTTLDIIDVSSASSAELVEGEWALEEDHTYQLTSALDDNGRWVGYEDYPTVGWALEVEGAWGTGGIHLTSWHTFTELTTSVCDD